MRGLTVHAPRGCRLWAAALFVLLSVLLSGAGADPARSDDVYLFLPPTEQGESAFGVSGPFPQPIGVALCAALNVGGVSLRDDLVAADGAGLFFLDLDNVAPGWIELQPAPPVPIDALTALDFAGTPAADLVAAAGNDLYVLDLDQPVPGWNGPLAQPVGLATLAGVDVGGVSPRPDLVAAAGADVFFLDLDAAGQTWQLLEPAPTFPVELLGTLELPIGQPPALLEVLVAVSGADLYAFPGDGWLGPAAQRFRITTLTAIELVDRGHEGAEQDIKEAVITVEPLAPTPIHFDDVTAAAGVAGYADPGGDGHCPGAVFADIDGDTFADLYLVRGSGQTNVLYLNDGAGRFLLQPGALGADDPRNSAGALLADFDNDGDQDIYVINFNERNTLYENRGGVFVDVTESTDPTPGDPPFDDQEGVGVGIIPTGCGPGGIEACILDHTLAAAWADIDRDGWLDLFVGNHRCCGYPDGERDVLYRNNRDGTFTDITVASGIAQDFPPGGARSTQAVIFADLDNDQWPDLYVTHKGNGPNKDELFLNDGDRNGDQVWDGTFSEYLSSLPPGSVLGEVSGAAMGIDVGDMDNDGDLDYYITDIGEMDLYKNLTAELGVFELDLLAGPDNPAPGVPFSWGTSWLDADNDGDVDLHVSTNNLVMDYLYQNDGGGAFTDVALAAGVGQARDTRSDVAADYDHDGWVDYFTANRGGDVSALFRNTTGVALSNHWLHMRLVGEPALPGPQRSTRDAIGARVTVLADTDGSGVAEPDESQIREVVSGAHSCASTSSLVLEFGTGRAATAERVTVEWPSGRVTTLEGVRADRLIEIFEAGAAGVGAGGAAPEAAALQLHRSAPNPAGPGTAITFSLPAAGAVTLTIHDVVGRRVATLIEEVREAGRHAVVWDGRSDAGAPAASGVYFVQLAAAGAVRTGRLVLVR